MILLVVKEVGCRGWVEGLGSVWWVCWVWLVTFLTKAGGFSRSGMISGSGGSGRPGESGDCGGSVGSGLSDHPLKGSEF